MMTQYIDVNWNDGVVTVMGTEQPETIVVRRDGDKLVFEGASFHYSDGRNDFPPGYPIERFTVDGLGGDDVIVNNTDILMTIRGGDGNDTLVGGDGNDWIEGGSGDDFIEGGAGHDTLFGDFSYASWSAVVGDWLVRGTGDFDGDGDADLLVQEDGTDQRRVWLMQNATHQSTVTLPTIDSRWSVAGIGDFDRDGDADVMYHLPGAEQRMVWLMQGGGYAGTNSLPSIDARWTVSGVGDFDRDGDADVMYHLPGAEQRMVWLMQGGGYAGTNSLPSIDARWSVSGVGDFDSDGDADVIYHLPGTEQRMLWVMQNGRYSNTNALPGIDARWSVAGVGDFDDDGDADLVWQLPVMGQNMVWEMQGARHANTGMLMPGPAGNDSLHGGLGFNRLDGGPGADELRGRTGPDVFISDGQDSLGDGAASLANGDYTGENRGFPVNWNDGVFYIDGTAHADTIVITQSNGRVFVPGWGYIANIHQVQVNGREGDDRLINATSLPSIIHGAGGEDVIHGGGGDDRLLGGEGNDIIHGNAGNDVLWGNAGQNSLLGGYGSDSEIHDDRVQLDIGKGTLRVEGTGGKDDVHVGDANGNVIVRFAGREVAFIAGHGVPLSEIEINGHGDDDYLRNATSLPSIIRGGSGNDTIFGGSAHDRIFGNDGQDRIDGNGGEDELSGGAGEDHLNGGDGNDTVSYEDARVRVIVDLNRGYAVGIGTSTLLGTGLIEDVGQDTLLGLENVVGSQHADEIYGDDGHNTLWGLGGDDYINGLWGDDVLYGGEDKDTLIGGPNPDRSIRYPSAQPSDTDTVYASQREGDTVRVGLEDRLIWTDPVVTNPPPGPVPPAPNPNPPAPPPASERIRFRYELAARDNFFWYAFNTSDRTIRVTVKAKDPFSDSTFSKTVVIPGGGQAYIGIFYVTWQLSVASAEYV